MQVHTFKKACVAAYPSTVQHNIVWFWPNTDPQYKDILVERKPPYIPQLDDPSYTKLMGNRDIPYGCVLSLLLI
jgi:phenylpropionate dioxygenase-like ring-hydroxylating dioxygenase large terminal subunit